ncbi:hypothetical protein [Falsiroseomonas sp. CW058]|uniref:hypothetical protein n=1 Tax=Falsiroseomonas sp. CW058 TaxID=3388664 RepID=UPI003D31F607
MPPFVAPWRRLPEPVRFLLRNGAVGFVLSALLVGALLAADPGDARRLLLEGAGHWWPAVVLWFFAGLTFGGVQIGAATMLLASADDRPRHPRRGTGVPVLAPVPVRARRR